MKPSPKITGFPDGLPPADHPLTNEERAVFGHDAVRHPITRLPLQSGSGALPEDVQAMQHLIEIEQMYGTAIADEIRQQLKVFIP